MFFEWFLNPLLIIKDQIKAERLSASEEDYLCKLVLFSGDAEKLKTINISQAPESEVKRAELDALARRYLSSNQLLVSYFKSLNNLAV